MEPYCLARLVIFLWRRRALSYVCSRNERFNGSAAASPFQSMCVYWPQIGVHRNQLQSKFPYVDRSHRTRGMATPTSNVMYEALSMFARQPHDSAKLGATYEVDRFVSLLLLNLLQVMAKNKGDAQHGYYSHACIAFACNEEEFMELGSHITTGPLIAS